jgi:hypothetical protein
MKVKKQIKKARKARRILTYLVIITFASSLITNVILFHKINKLENNLFDAIDDYTEYMMWKHNKVNDY